MLNTYICHHSIMAPVSSILSIVVVHTWPKLQLCFFFGPISSRNGLIIMNLHTNLDDIILSQLHSPSILLNSGLQWRTHTPYLGYVSLLSLRPQKKVSIIINLHTYNNLMLCDIILSRSLSMILSYSGLQQHTWVRPRFCFFIELMSSR